MGFFDWLKSKLGGTDSGTGSDKRPPTGPDPEPEAGTRRCPRCQTLLPASNLICTQCSKRRPDDWDKVPDTYTISTPALSLAAMLTLVLALVASGRFGGGGLKTAAAVVSLGVMATGARAAPVPTATPAPTQEPGSDVQGGVGDNTPAVQSNNCVDDGTCVGSDPGITAVDPATTNGCDHPDGCSGTTSTTTSTNNGVTTTCDQNGCTTDGSGSTDGSTTGGGGMNGCDHPDGCGSGGSTTGRSDTGGSDTGGGGSGSGSGSG
jgi:hypothetical protein